MVTPEPRVGRGYAEIRLVGAVPPTADEGGWAKEWIEFDNDFILLFA